MSTNPAFSPLILDSTDRLTPSTREFNSSLWLSRRQAFKPGTATAGSGEHRHGRPLVTPDEIMRLGPTRPIVMIAGEPPYLLDRLDYRTDPAFAGRFDPNPMHFPAAAQ